MSKKFKSTDEVIKIAAAIQARRLAAGLTLKDIEKSQGIDCGQLSRLEKGSFKTNSPNLQKLCSFLQIEYSAPRKLGERIEQFASRSPTHRAAAEEVLNALERLG